MSETIRRGLYEELESSDAEIQRDVEAIEWLKEIFSPCELADIFEISPDNCKRRDNPAAVLGALGGKQTAKRGPEYFSQIAAMRKSRKGGKPHKGNSQENLGSSIHPTEKSGAQKA